jgi:alcohol dehydrogenase
MDIRYYIPTEILFGEGKLNELHEKKMPGKKALIIISNGKSMKANGYLERVEKELETAGVDHVLYDQILPNPVLRHVMEGAQVAKENQCDFVIGLGGGSSIDSAKAIAVMATNPGDYWDYNFCEHGGKKPLVNAPLPIIAITTTAGTGSEADPWTVTTNEETLEKVGFGCDATYPVLSIVDPELMMTVPAHLTAYQGFDALFHACESVINNREHEIGEMFALKAVEYLAGYLPRAVQDGSDKEARAHVALANTLAGFFMMCTSEHSMEHAMSAFHHSMPHGAGLIMISRAYYQHFADCHACDERMIRLAKAMGKTDANSAQDFVDLLIDMENRCNVGNLKMSDYGVTEDEFPKFVSNARTAMGGLFFADPAMLTDEDVIAIYQKSFA